MHVLRLAVKHGMELHEHTATLVLNECFEICSKTQCGTHRSTATYVHNECFEICCRTLYRTFKNTKHLKICTQCMFSDLLLDTIGSTDHVTSCEALIYCVGAVKFLTGNSDILKRLARLDCVKVFANLMHSIIKTVRLPQWWHGFMVM